ncbi:MAG: RHS repeat protein, partial [Bacteroidales bacterium]|nr:RHS repeat protein [Bacteroidales bacterium]
MKKFLKHIYNFVVICILISAAIVFTYDVSMAQDKVPEVYLDIDSVEGGATLPNTGGSVTISFTNSRPVSESDFADYVIAQIKNSEGGGWITDVGVSFEQHGYWEGTISFSVTKNDGPERKILFSANAGSALISQDGATPNVYKLTSDKDTIARGETFSLRLSGSDPAVVYDILRRVSGGPYKKICDMEGTGEPWTLFLSDDGKYSAISSYPFEVAMNGRPEVHYYSFYNYVHSATVPGTNYTIELNKNGDKKVIPFIPNSSSKLFELYRILSTYSSGNSEKWNKAVHISYSNGYLTVSSPLNNSGSTITDSTFFKVNSSNNTLVFRQQAGGSLQRYTLSADTLDEEPLIKLSSSQYYVTYRLYKDNVRYNTGAITGTGSEIYFHSPIDAGKYTIKAFYQNDSLVMNGYVEKEARVLPEGNYIIKDTYTYSTGIKYISDITYYDGLGYPEQVIQVHGSPAGKNIVTPVWYDAVMRADAKTYLPYVSQQSSLEKDNSPFTMQKNYYASKYGTADSHYAYVQNVYEQSPLNRVVASYNPGNAFRGADSKCSSYGYETNAIGEVLLLKTDSDNSLKAGGYYSAGKLYKNSVTNEDGTTTIVYTDADGKTILERKSLPHGSSANTYYVYDALGRIAWVITPTGSSLLTSNTRWGKKSTYAVKYCYRYVYDGKNNMTEKLMPGAVTVRMVYDPAGRMVAVRDSVLAKSGKWKLTRYDSLGRAVKQYLTPAVTISAMQHYFSTTPYPAIYNNSSNILLSEYHYGVTAPSILAFSGVNDVVSLSDIYDNTTGMKTWEKTADLSTIGGRVSYVQRAFYYDIRGRLRQSVELNPDGGVNRTSYKYNFTGNVIAASQTYIQGSTSRKLNETFTYDDRGRLLTAISRLDNGVSSVIAYTYDDLGRLKTTTYGSGTANSITQTDTYDIQGWLTVRSAKQGTTNLYSQNLRYYDPEKGTTALYSGNISEWTVRQGTNASSTYGFLYDENGRLMGCSRYSGNGTSDVVTYTERGISYDGNGNIKTLQRYGASTRVP